MEEYAEDLLSPTDTSSVEEAEPRHEVDDSSITGSKVSEAVKHQLPKGSGCCRAVPVDTPLQRCVEICGAASGLAGRSGGPMFKKGYKRMCSNTGGPHSLASLERSMQGYWRGEFGR